MPVLTSKQQEQKSKQRKIRNSEYYDMISTFDGLYADSKKDKIFNHLMEIIESEENIKLAYRTIKTNTGSDTAGVDKRTINDLAKLSEEEYVRLIRKQFSCYHPRPVKRVEIPKPNGKTRPLGIPTIVDRVVQQCILQVMEPICEAKFSDNSYGFRPNRSAEHAIAQCMRLIQVQHMYHVVDLDIKGFFDNINHTKLIRQIWALGIRDKKLLCIIKEMLKAPVISLREKVKEIQKDLDDGIDTIGKKMTVCQLYAKQIRHRGNVRYNTKNGRKRLMKLLEEDKLGGCPIDSVKLSDAKEWAIRMKEKGISYKTISNDKRSLKAAFYTAIQDDCIRKNPFDFQLNTVIEDDTEPKVPLTPAQEESFLSFAQNDKVYQKYYDELIILLGTGLRISELCGLTDTDINFENRIINVDHQLLRSAETGYYIETPKTKSGIRQIPMSEKVYEAFNRVLKRRRGAKAVTIDGYSNFLFLNRDGYPKTATNYDGMFRGLAKKYNKYHEEALPKVMTPHTLRHTFCTNMANAGMNPKALQYIMGHSNITMTLNYYAHATFDSAKAEMLRIAA